MRVRGNREKINNKISNTRATVTVHICMVTVVIVYKYTILHPLMWVFFWPKYVKWRDFCILENYTPTDMDALRVLSQSGMSLIDPLDLYLAFALFFLRLLQTHFRFFFLNFFFFFHLHPFLGHYIQLWVGTHSWALSPHLWGFVLVHGILHLIQGSLVLDLQPFKFGVATMSTTKFLLNNMAFYFIIKWHISKFDPNLF